ncbi:CG3797 [Drosophila busckii]|uniref:CG3797 n=1 Tax=Drosophila busckii TaxID=30019 RepID=A0A0M3QX30_DROBS|nr:UDP-glucuronosyltransferase [Drosophila busckii]ALC45149.1 CG3797 [Drosophila busckii]
MRQLLLLLSLALLGSLETATGANVLAVLPSVWRSHYLFGRRLLQQLVAGPQNHSVTLISPHASLDSELPNIREIRIEDQDLMQNWLDMGMSFEAEQMHAQSVMERFTRLIYAGTTNVDMLLSDAQVRKLLTSGEKFDLLIVDLFLSDALLGLAYYYNVPTVAISPTGANAWLNHMFGNPQSSNLDPSNFLPFTERMSTRQRIINTLMSTFERLTYNFFYLISQQSVYSNHFDLLAHKELPHYRDLSRNLSLALINSHPALDYPRAYLPNMLEVGGLHLLEQSQLQVPNHVDAFMAAAPSGVIYFSLGADVQTAQLPSDKLAVLLDVFAHLKEFHFLLKWETEEFVQQQLPENIMLSSWWPQQALLAHPQLKLFISSCGQLSVWESIAGDTPILAIPILAEQQVLAKRLQLQGAALSISYESLSYDALLHGIRQLTLNESYVHELAALKLRLNMINSQATARALNHIELVLETGGAQFLKSHANTLNFWRSEGLDVLLIIVLGLFTILTVPFVVTCCILRRSYYSQAAQQQQQPYRSTLKAVGRMHSYGEPSSCTSGAGGASEPLRRTRSAQSLSARSSCSSFSSTTPTTPSTASSTPLDLTPTSSSAVPALQLYVNQGVYATPKASQDIKAGRAFL